MSGNRYYDYTDPRFRYPCEGKARDRTYRCDQLHDCRGHRKADGQACKNSVAEGFRVCDFHGGSNPNTIRAVRSRFMEMVPTIEERYWEMIGRADFQELSPRDQAAILSAMKDVLDRAGVTAIRTVEQKVLDPASLDVAIEELEAELVDLRRSLKEEGTP